MAQITVENARALMQGLYNMATGKTDLSVATTKDFVSAGSKLLEMGSDIVTGHLTQMIGETEIDIRAYRGKGKLIQVTANAYTALKRQISFYSTDITDLTAFGNDIGEGQPNYQAQTQHYVVPVEVYFGKSAGWKKKITMPLVQLQIIMTNEEEFAKYVSGVYTQLENDIQKTLEGKTMAVILDRIAGTKLLTEKSKLGAECLVYVEDEFNKEYGTSYTYAELIEDHKEEFLKWFAAYVQILSDRMEELSVLYHDPLTEVVNAGEANEYTRYVDRHTPKADQKFLYFKPLFTMAKASVLPSIFNPQYIPELNGEGVQYWQDIKKPMAVAIKPALPGWDNVTSENVYIDNCIGILFDTKALAINNQFEASYTDRIDIDTLTQNTAWYYVSNPVNNYTHNAVVFCAHNVVSTATFTGDGTTKNFTISADVVRKLDEVKVGDTVLTSGFTLDGKTVKFTTAPANNAAISIKYE